MLIENKENYKHHFKPYLKRDRFDTTNSWKNCLCGGIIGAIYSFLFLYFVFVFLAWWVVLYFSNEDISYSILPIFIVEPRHASTFSSISAIFGLLLALVYSGFFNTSNTIYRKSHRLFSESNNDKYLQCVHFNEDFDWKKLKEKTPSYIIKNINSTDDVYLHLRNIIYCFSSQGYKVHHYLEGTLIINQLPIPKDFLQPIINKCESMHLSEESKLDFFRKEEFKSYNWLLNNNYISQKVFEFIRNRENNISEKITELSRSIRTDLPPVIQQAIEYGFNFLFTVLIPNSWRGFGFIWGSLISWLIILIYIGLTKGIERMKKIFENQNKNPTIYGETVGKECRRYSQRIFDLCESYLKDNNLHLDFDDEYSTIKKYNYI